MKLSFLAKTCWAICDGRSAGSLPGDEYKGHEVVSADADLGRLLLYAPNVHTGGGLVLLQELLDAWSETAELQAWLDLRAQPCLRLPSHARVIWVTATVCSRLRAESSLSRSARVLDRVLCFHGLPPLLPVRAKVLVFLQNYYYLGKVPLHLCTWRVRLRSRAEQFLSRCFRRRVSLYLVQSPTMLRKLRDWFGQGGAPVQILPLVPVVAAHASTLTEGTLWDFVYAADGQMHKNHYRLIEAWRALSAQGLNPSLALPLPERDFELRQWIDQEAREHRLNICTMDPMPHGEMLELYRAARALLFPSTGESFGLPLYEASRLGVPIVASERDYVRDVCEPVQSFDPESAVSIARAVARFLGTREPPLAVRHADSFLQFVRSTDL